VWPAKKPPAELHGVAKGLFVNLAAGLGISAGSTLKTEAVRQADGSLVFANTTLKLPIGGNPMCIQPEERHYSPGTHEAPAETAVGFRLTQAKSGAVVSLPAIDTSFALSNLSDEAGRVTKGLILEAGKQWLNGLNSGFIDAVGTPVLDTQTHSTRFQVQSDRDPDITKTGHALHTVFSAPPGIATKPEETARTGVVLKSKTVEFLHGGDRVDGYAATLKQQMIAAETSTFGPFLRTFKTFWNALWTLAPADQVLRTKLRDYLGLTRPALDQDKDKDSVNSLLAAVIEAVYGSVNIPGFDAAVLISIRAKIPPLWMPQVWLSSGRMNTTTSWSSLCSKLSGRPPRSPCSGGRWKRFSIRRASWPGMCGTNWPSSSPALPAPV
jgi:hypothetical protein